MQGDLAESQETRWPIFVISLRDAVERRQKIEASLNGLGHRFQFIDAVDGRSGLHPSYEAMIDRAQTPIKLGRQMADAEYACALSHIAIYNRIIEDKLDGAVVLEDDAIIGPAFAKFYRSQSYLGFDLIQLDHCYATVSKLQTAVVIDPELSVIKAAKNAILTTGYTISRRGAMHILTHALPISSPADWPCDVTVIPAMLAVPRIVDHPSADDNNSSIEAARRELTIPIHRVAGAKRFLHADYWRRWWVKRTTRRVS